jgi:hypothetical protein
MKKALIIAAVAVLAFGANANATMVSINAPGVVGILDMNGCSGGPCAASDPFRLIVANQLLTYAANVDAQYGSTAAYYHTSTTNYIGTVSGGYKVDTGATTGFAGYQYLLAKYDGPGAGYVLFYIPTWGTSVPSSLGAFEGTTVYWDDTGAGLSGWTAYNWVPDGGSVAMLLGLGLMGLAGFRRMLK